MSSVVVEVRFSEMQDGEMEGQRGAEKAGKEQRMRGTKIGIVFDEWQAGRFDWFPWESRE